CQKCNCEQQRDCPGASQRSARHFRHQRVKQISKNRSDRHRDQDWLEKTDDTRASPDHGGEDHHQNNDEKRSERCPHHLALPSRGILLHLSTSSKIGTGARQLHFTWTSVFDVQYSVFELSILVRSDWSSRVIPCRSSF